MKQTTPSAGSDGHEAGPAGRAEPGRVLGDDGGAGRPGDVARAVGGAVVDHDRPVAGRHGGEERRQRRRFVEDGDDHVGHDIVCIRTPAYGAPAEVLTIR